MIVTDIRRTDGIIVDEEYTAHVASAEEVEDSLVRKPQGILTSASLSFSERSVLWYEW